MTAAVLTRAPAPAGARPAVRPATFLPWLLPVTVAAAGLVQTGTPAGDIAIYGLYFALGVVLPGTLVHRALRGSRGNWPEDLGLGAATGLVTLLIGWAAAAATGMQVLLPGWPLLVLAVFLAVPRLRPCWRIADPKPLPLSWSWIVAAGLTLVTLSAYAWWRSTPLPPVTTIYYQDLMYHLALVHEMTRSMPFQVPQLAGDTLRYHYLSDADMAAGSMITGIEPAVVLLRLWIVPVAGTAVLVVAALARDLTGKWWAGALGGVAGLVALPATFGAPVGSPGGTALVLASPSQTYALPLFGLLLILAVDAVRGVRLGRAWWLILPLALACAGAKSSVLPPLVAGLLLAAVVVLLRHRERLVGTAGFLGLTGVAMLAGMKIFAGGGASTLGLQPFALLYWFEPYKDTLGFKDQIDGTRLLPLGIAEAGGVGLAFVAGIFGWSLLTQAPRLLGLAGLLARRTRQKPEAWLLAGVTASALGAAWLLWHPSASQVYFYVGVIPFATVMTVWLLADEARGRRPVVAGLLAGGLWAAFAPRVAHPETLRGWAWAMAWPMLRTALIAVVVAAIGLAAWRFATGRLAWRALPVALIAAVVGAGLGVGVNAGLRGGVRALTDPPQALDRPYLQVTREEMTAALWLDEHAGAEDVIATNVHCSAIGWRTCDARAFWVSGLGGRRAVVESWGYSDQAVAADGVGGKRYYWQPAPYPQRWELNQRVFAAGRAEGVAELRDRYRVRWLFADRRAAGGVSPELARHATERFTLGPVSIYELA